MANKEICPLREICRETWKDFTFDLDKNCPMRKILGQIPMEVKEFIKEKILDKKNGLI